MQLSETVKLYMTKEQEILVKTTMVEYINTVNQLVSIAMSGTPINKYTTADVDANLPSAISNQCIRDAKSIVKKHNKLIRQTKVENKPTVPVLKKPCFYINNQNFKLNGNIIEVPIWVDGKSKRIKIRTAMTDRQKEIFSKSKLGTMRIVYKGNRIVAQVIYRAVEEEHSSAGIVMGIDLGIKCPAVSYNTDGSVKFYGNGRKNKYIRRRYQSLRKKLQKKKQIKALKHMGNKEQRIMNDIDHKISHEIIKTAIAHNVKLIKLERLSNIRSTTRTSRKNNRNLHNWSFHRLTQYIEYKAKLAGIKVEYVNPAYTSQKCPVCGHIYHANDRKYTCTCGYHTHRDLLGAINICNSTEYVGDRNVRHTA